MAATGWNLGPYALIARKIGAPLIYWIAKHEEYDGNYTILSDPLFTGFPEPFIVLPIPSDAPHFPYGWAVVAD